MSLVIKEITEPYTVSEGPHWDVEQQALYFISLFEHGIHKYQPATGRHTWTKLHGPVGFVIPVEGMKDTFVTAVGRNFLVIEWDGNDGTPVKIVRDLGEVAQDKPTTRINDGKADAKGRLFAGTMGASTGPGEFEHLQGYFYRIDRGNITKLEDNITLSNGMAWDSERKAYYYIDSFEYNIRRYDYDVETGEISNKTYIFDFKKNGITGVPDGTAIDTDGNLWVAVFGGGCVLKIDPATGKLLEKIDMPVDQITSVAFGGPNLDTMFVTSANINMGGQQKPVSGAVFAITGLSAKGHPGNKYKL